jgi:hypothetical protein
MSTFQLPAPVLKSTRVSQPPPSTLGKRVARNSDSANPGNNHNYDDRDQQGTNVTNPKIHINLKAAPFSNKLLSDCFIPGTVVFASKWHRTDDAYIREEVLLPIQVINNTSLEVTFLDTISRINKLNEKLSNALSAQSRHAVFQSGTRDAVQDYYNKFRYLGVVVSLLQEPEQSKKNTSSRDLVVSVGGHCSSAKNLFYSTQSYSSNLQAKINCCDNLWIVGKNLISTRDKSVDVAGETRLSHLPYMWSFTLYGINTCKSSWPCMFIEDTSSSYRPLWDVSHSIMSDMHKTNANSRRSCLNMNHGVESGNCIRKSFKKGKNGHYELQVDGENNPPINYKYNSLSRAAIHKAGNVLFDKGTSQSNVEQRLFDKHACDISREFELIGRII